MLKIYMIRHGQSLYQSLKIVSGINEYGLSGIGKMQSKKMGTILSQIKFDQVYCSDLKRCIESYQLIEQQLTTKPHEVKYTHLLRERDPGVDSLKAYNEVYNLNSQYNQTKYIDGESDEELQGRVRSFLNQLITDYLYKRSYQNLPKHSLNQLLLGSQIMGTQNHSLHMMKPILQAQPFSSTKFKWSTNVMVMSHAGFITETLSYLYRRQGHQIDQPNFYARNASLFLLELDVQDQDNWKADVFLKNYNKKLQTPFEHAY